jgi:hypothetical protein
VNIPGWPGAGAGNFHEIARGSSQDSFGEMTPTRIAGAEDKNERFFHERIFRNKS